MKGFSFFFQKPLMGRLAPYRKWGLMLIPLASVSTVPLVWFWGNHGGHSGHMPDSTTVSAEIQPPAPSSPLPPLSQIPLPPNTPTPSSVSGLKNPRPLMMSSPPKTTTKGNQASIESKNSQSDPGSRPSPSQPSATSPQSSTAITPSFSSPPLPQAQPRRQSSPPSIAYRPPLEIRVGIQRDVPSVMVTASTQAEIQNRHGQGLMTLNASQPLTFQSQDGSLLANGRVFPGMVWVTPTANSYLGVSDRWYRGRILLVARGNTVLAVNYLDLENYLISVVGSEMHSNAPIEALKAQAIAARSYALVHMIRPASDWFDLGDTQRWQVYKGINSEVNSAHHAVKETLGEVLSYNGGVVESLYAATDEIVARVHKGRGMSQYGAYDLANSGYNYQQILNRYYPGGVVARMIVNSPR